VNDITILKKHQVVQQAQQSAQKEYEKLFNAWHPYITSSHHGIVRELFAAENMIGYVIQVNLDTLNTPAPTAKLNEIKTWAREHLSSDRLITLA